MWCVVLWRCLRCRGLVAVLTVFFMALMVAQLAAQDALLREDRSRLLAGVAEFSFSGSPGIAVATSPRCIDLIHDKAGMSLAVAGRHGSGKFIVMTQGLDSNEAPGARRFVDNLLGWLRAETDTRPVLCVQAAGTAASLKKLKLPVAEAKRLPADLSAYSVIYLSYPWVESDDYSDAEIKRLRDWVAAGGSLWCHALGWVYLKYHETGIARGNLKLWSANRIFGPLGVWIAAGTAGTVQPFAEAPASLTATLERALTQIEGSTAASPEAADSLLLSLANLQYSGLSVSALIGPTGTNRLAAAYAKLGPRVVPRPDKPVPASDPAARLCVGLLALLGAEDGAAGLPKPASAAVFPGVPPAEAKPLREATWTSQACTLWQSTGWYAPPGTPVTIKLNRVGPVDYKVKIGAHSDDLLWRPDRNPEWRRWPTLVRVVESQSDTVVISSTHGGLIHIDTGGVAGLRFSVSGAIPAALYRLGLTSPDQWKSQMTGTTAVQAPWGELEGERIILTLPLATLRKIPDPQRITAFWDQAIRLLDELTGDPPRPYKERIVTDEQIAYGYMHGGYPVMCLLDNAEIMAGLPGEWDIFQRGSWGLFHELGHNWQKNDWIFSKSWEVTVNIFTIWLLDQLVGIPPGEHPYLIGALPTGAAYKAAGRNFATWDESKMMAALLFVDLIKAGGWEAFKGFYRYWLTAQPFELPKTDDAIRDTWVRELSRHAGKDLSPVFRDWGIPHTPMVWPLPPSAPRRTLIDAAVADGTKVYWFQGTSWSVYDAALQAPVPGYPRPIAADWPFPWAGAPDAAFPAAASGQAWFTKGSQVALIDLATRTMAAGYPSTIEKEWPGVWPSGFDAAIPYGDGKLYLFKGDSYLTWDIARKRLTSSGATKTSTGWRGLDFDRIDEVIVIERRFWFFRHGWAALYPYGNGRVVEGYPKALDVDWPKLGNFTPAAP